MANLDHYKVLASNDDHFEVEKQGKKFKVAKKHLDEATKSRIQGMFKGGEVEHMYGGGDVEPSIANTIGQYLGKGADILRNKVEDDFLVPAFQGATATASTLADVGSGIKQGFSPPKVPDVQLGPKLASGEGVLNEIPESEMVDPSQQVPVVEAAPTTAPVAAPADPMQSFIEEQKKAINQKQLAEQQQARDEATALEQQQLSLEMIAEEHAKARKPIDDQVKAVSDAIVNGEVNPNRYYENQSTGNQITASIALALGGLGGALDRTGRNAAAETIQKAIDRDIDAQKENLANKRSAMSQLMAQGKSIDEAADIQKLNALTAARSQLDLAAARARDPLAAANAANARSVLDLQIQQLKDANTKKNVEKAIVGPGGTAFNPAQMGGEYAEKYAKTTVQGPDGRFYQARSPEVAGKLAEKAALSTEVKSLVRKLEKYGPEALAGGAASADAAALKVALLRLNEISGIKEGSLKLVAEMFDNPTKLRDMFVQGSSSALVKNVDRALNSEFRNSTINYSGGGSPLTTLGPADFARTKGKEAVAKLAQNVPKK
jgi:hypothetical protein